MAPECDICFDNFDLLHHRPKSLPCGHTICNECVLNPDLESKCPACREDFGLPGCLPDNIFVIKMIDEDSAPARKVRRLEDTKEQQLQRGVAAGKTLMQQLQQVVPKAVEALNRQLDSTAALLRTMEAALERRAAGDVGAAPAPDEKQLQVAAQLEDSLRLFTTAECSVVAEEAGATWKASVPLGRFDDILRLLLLKLRAENQLEKVGAIAVPAPPPPAAYVGPPIFSVLEIHKNDLDDGTLKVNDILGDGRRWKNVRSLRNLTGSDSEKLLRIVAPHLEELHITCKVQPSVMKEIEKMPSLKRLQVKCDEDFEEYPDLPLQLEELAIDYPNENQMRCVQRMPGLRSLKVYNVNWENYNFPPSQHGKLLWLGVAFNVGDKASMLSLIRAYAASLQELMVYCTFTNEDDDQYWYFPDLGQDLAECGLQALRRLVLDRPSLDPCEDAAGCLLQRLTIQRSLPSSVDVVCESCHISVF